ncbi:MAG TPA: hypothetical protein VF828_01590 [Patescibacteria group bacterium]
MVNSLPHFYLALGEPIHNPVINNPLTQVNDPKGYTNNVLSTVFTIFFIVGIVYFVWHFVMAGYHWIASEGDVKKIEVAKNEFTYAILGLGVVFVTFAVLKFVGTIVGIPGLTGNVISIPWPTL